jgi:hypothetical protein
MASLLVGAFLVLLAIVVVFWLLKNIVKAAVAGLIVLIIVFGVYWAFIYKDFSDIRTNLSIKEKVFILEKEGELLTGMVIGKLSLNESPTFMDFDMLERLQKNFSDKEYAGMLGDNYRMFVISDQAFLTLPEEINVSGELFDKADVLRAMTADDEDELLAEGDIASGRGYAFAVAFEAAMQERGPSFLIEEYLGGNIITYPETSLFKSLKEMPGFLKRMLLKRLSDKPAED